MNFLIVFCANYLLFFVVLGLVVAWLRLGTNGKIQLLVTTVFAGIIALALAKLAAHLYFDPRPFVTAHVQPLIAHAADNGFPSDHALLTMTVTAVAYFFSKKIASAMLVLTVLVGIARVLANVHRPLDIAGAWLFGSIGAIAGYRLMLYFFNRYNTSHANHQPNA